MENVRDLPAVGVTRLLSNLLTLLVLEIAVLVCWPVLAFAFGVRVLRNKKAERVAEWRLSMKLGCAPNAV